MLYKIKNIVPNSHMERHIKIQYMDRNNLNNRFKNSLNRETNEFYSKHKEKCTIKMKLS